VTTPDGVAFEMTIEAVKPWAIEGLLDGTIDRFSIGWDPGTADILCSACGESMWPASSCNHWPGDTLEAKDGSTKFVEAIFTSAEGTEVSAVSVPAVDGTGVAQIRAALAAHRSGEMPRKEGPMNKFQKLAKALGLSEDADVEMVASATLGKLSALEGALASKDEELKVAATKVATFERAQLASAADVLVEQSIRDGRLIPKLGADGKRIETPVESAIRDMVSRLGLAAAESYVGTLPKVAPVGPTALAEATAPARDGGRALSAGRQEVAKQLGLTEDQIQKGADRLRARGFGVA
jgi:phage I-like protein